MSGCNCREVRHSVCNLHCKECCIYTSKHILCTAPPPKPKLTDAERILAAYGSNLPVMDCIVEKHNAPYPSIAWFKDGVQLHSGPTVTLTPRYTMSHPSFRLSLAITNFSPDARGRYYCVAANGLGEAKSDPVYVDLEGRLLSRVPGLLHVTQLCQ